MTVSARTLQPLVVGSSDYVSVDSVARQTFEKMLGEMLGMKATFGVFTTQDRHDAAYAALERIRVQIPTVRAAMRRNGR